MEVTARSIEPEFVDEELTESSNHSKRRIDSTNDDKETSEIPLEFYRDLDVKFARHGVLPETHPLVQYVYQLFSRISDDPSVKIVIFEGTEADESAFVTASRIIVLSKEILSMCDTEEELLFILHHELNHLLKGHFNTDFGSGTLPEALGRQRLQENLDADIGSLLDLDKKGINIAGAFSFFSKLKEKDKGKKSISHGSALERLIGLKLTLNLKDFDHYDPSKQTPLPKEVFNEKNLKDTFGFPVFREGVNISGRTKLRMERIETMSFRELFVNYLDLRQSYRKAGYAFDKDHRFMKEKTKYYKPLMAKMFELIVRKGLKELGLEEGEMRLLMSLIVSIERIIPKEEHAKLLHKMNLEKSKYQLTSHEVSFQQDLFEILKDNELTSACNKFLEKLQTISIEGRLYYPINIPEVRSVIYQNKELLAVNEEAAKLVDLFETIFLEMNSVEEEPKCPNTQAVAQEVSEAHTESKDSANKLRPDEIFTPEESHIYGEFVHNMIIEIGDMEQEIYEEDKYGGNRYKYPAFEIEAISVRHLSLGCANFIYNLFRQRENAFDLDFVNKKIETIELDKFTPIERLYMYTTLSSLIGLYGLQSKMKLKEFKMMAQDYINNLQNVIDQIKPVDGLSPNVTMMGSDFIKGSIGYLKNLSLKATLRNLKEYCDVFKLPERAFAGFLIKWFKLVNKNRKFKLEDFEEVISSFSNPEDLNYFLGVRGENYFAGRFEKYILNLPVDSLDIDVIERIVNVYSKVNQTSDNVFYKFLSSYDWNFENMKECFVAYRLCAFCADPVKSNILRKKISNAMIEIMHKEDISLKDFFEKIPDTIKLSFEAVEHLIEDEAKTAEEMEACKKYLETIQSPDKVGKLVAMDSITTELVKKEPLNLIRALLNPDNDDELRELVFNALYKGQNYKLVLMEGGRHAIVDIGGMPQQIIDGLYSIDDYQRQSLIHALLTGPNGILTSEEAMSELIDFFFDKFIEPPEDKEDETFINEAKKILKLTISNAKPEDIYFILSKLLHSRILKAPKKDKWGHLKSVKRAYRDFNHKNNYDEVEANKELNEFIFGTKGEIYNLRRKTKHYFETPELERNELEKIDSVGLLIEIAQSLGSIGVRFLQLMGMYMEVPQKYEAAINKTFSDLKGQYKLTAYETLKERIPVEMLEGLEIGKRLGGGSILTVYPFESKQTHGVIKVVNPNIVGQMRTIFDVLETTFDQLVEENKERYEALRLLLNDVRDWVLADVKIADCVELDKQFRRQNTGMVSSSGKFTSAVPQLLYSNGKSVIEEEAIGRTLQYSNLESEEMKDVIELIRSLLGFQVANGIVHSDVHPGNFIVTDKNILQILDRTLLLKLTPEESELLISSAMQGDTLKMINYFIGQVLNLSVNSHIDPETANDILEQVGDIIKDPNLDVLSKAKKALVCIRKNGVKISFNLSMTVKNLLAVETMMARVS